MTEDPQDQHLRVMIERLQREGRSESEIVRAVEEASGEPLRLDGRPARKNF